MTGLAFPKGLPRALTKRQKRAEDDAALGQAYRDVDLRDGPWCRATGRYTWPGAPDPRVRREHDHLLPRSTHPELVAEPSNIYVVAAEIHQLIHAGLIHVEGEDASQTLIFHWDKARIPDGKEPFRLIRRRVEDE